MKILRLIIFLLLISNLLFAQQPDSIQSENNNVFKFHPNPVENELFILGTHKIKTIEFIDVLGKQAAIYHFDKSIIKINISYLKSGIYLLQVIDENEKVETKKLVVK